MRRITYILLLFILGQIGLKAQGDIQYTQYMHTVGLFNPAYVLEDPFSIKAIGIFKSQWNNMEGAPQFYSFLGQGSFSKNIQTGLSFTNNTTLGGLLRESSVLINTAYNLKLSEKYYMSLGLMFGVNTFFTQGFENLKLNSGANTTDPAFTENLSIFNPNLGAGVYFHTSKHYIGLSSPNFLPNEAGSAMNKTNKSTSVFLVGGYVLDVIQQKIKIKPSIVFRLYIPDNRYVADFSVNTLLLKSLDLGFSYRLKESYSILSMLTLTDALKMGYSYDFTTSDLGQYNSGSHEFLISFNFFVFNANKGYIKSPRFF